MNESTPIGILEERHSRILELLGEVGSVRVGDLSRRFRVSEVTIRTDLERLARQGFLARFRGGAVAHIQTRSSSAFADRLREGYAEKERIAARAAEMVKPGDTLLLDAGTTVLELAKRLEGCSPLTVVTNALNTAATLSSIPDIHVIMAGGSVSPETVSTIGYIAERDIADLVVDKVFLGTHSFDPELGMMDISVEVARVKRAMIEAGRQVVLLADSSKFAKRALAKVAPLGSVDMLVTDTGLGDAETSAIEVLGVEVVRV